MPLEEERGEAVMAYMNEAGDYMMWGKPDSIGTVQLVESMRLTDGNWTEPHQVSGKLSNGGYADYPFMMPDGVTLYYASDGDDSMGGYDIFVATRDPQTGEYLQPQNVGMPFNSPHDDYLLAIDEENGVGWWATDRNLLGDKLTVYVYVVNDLRKNYSPDEEDILKKARLTDYKSTQDPEMATEYAELAARIQEIDPDEVKKEADFYFPKAGGEYYTSLDDFHKPAARTAMNKYLKAADALKKEEAKLEALRRRYAVNHADNVKEEIIPVEQSVERQRQELIRLRSDVYRLEFSK